METNKFSTRTYVTGFGLSLLLTLGAYFLAKHHLGSRHLSPSDSAMQLLLPAMAVIQLFVQLFFFLHLGREAKPRWKSWAAAFAILVVLIIVIGSIWIMDNLNYRMTPNQINSYLKSQDGGI